MITFQSPIKLQPPSITLPDGTQIDFPLITITKLDYNIMYSNSGKFAKAKFSNLPLQLILWKGDDYDAAGQFTDTDVQSRITTILGNNPQKVLQGLFPKQA